MSWSWIYSNIIFYHFCCIIISYSCSGINFSLINTNYWFSPVWIISRVYVHTGCWSIIHFIIKKKYDISITIYYRCFSKFYSWRHTCLMFILNNSFTYKVIPVRNISITWINYIFISCYIIFSTTVYLIGSLISQYWINYIFISFYISIYFTGKSTTLMSSSIILCSYYTIASWVNKKYCIFISTSCYSWNWFNIYFNFFSRCIIKFHLSCPPCFKWKESSFSI